MDRSNTIPVGITRSKKHNQISSGLPVIMLAMFTVVFMSFMMASVVYVGHADNFTDIFYTNSFRGAFSWIRKLDWVGMIVQCVISCFSLFGVALMTIRIMTSMLYLSSKGLWEEVHDLKQSGGESDLYDFGLINMAQSWAKGKAGTGLDAIIGAVLILLPDVKKYSDFGEKASGDFDENMSISQYMLKILIPTIMTVFFFAMGFNGTLFQFLAVTVDAMGTAADKMVSINYAGLVEDLVNKGTGYKFYFNANNTNLGNFQQNIATDIYGRLVTEVHGADAEQLYVLGQRVEKWVENNIQLDTLATADQVSERVKNGLATGSVDGNEGTSEGTRDSYVPYLGYEVRPNGSANAVGSFKSVPLKNWFEGSEEGFGDVGDVPRLNLSAADTTLTKKYLHIFIRQASNYQGTYINLDGTSANNGNLADGVGGGAGGAGGVGGDTGG